MSNTVTERPTPPSQTPPKKKALSFVIIGVAIVTVLLAFIFRPTTETLAEPDTYLEEITSVEPLPAPTIDPAPPVELTTTDTPTQKPTTSPEPTVEPASEPAPVSTSEPVPEPMPESTPEPTQTNSDNSGASNTYANDPIPEDADGKTYDGTHYYKYEGDQLYIWVNYPAVFGGSQWQESSGYGSIAGYTFNSLWKKAMREEIGAVHFVDGPGSSVDVSKVRLADGTIMAYNEYLETEKMFKEKWETDHPEMAIYEKYVGNYWITRHLLTGKFEVFETPEGEPKVIDGDPMTIEEFNQLKDIFGYGDR